MNRILAVIAIIFVAVAFAVVAVIVFITRGKSAFWVDKKLKVGGALLTLSSIIAGSSGCGVYQPTCYDTPRTPDPGEVMCYDVAVDVYEFWLTSYSNKERLVVEGQKRGGDGQFVYKLVHENDTIASGKLDIDTTGRFKIDLGKKGPTGEYKLAIDEAQGFATWLDFKIKDDTK